MSPDKVLLRYNLDIEHRDIRKLSTKQDISEIEAYFNRSHSLSIFYKTKIKNALSLVEHLYIEPNSMVPIIHNSNESIALYLDPIMNQYNGATIDTLSYCFAYPSHHLGIHAGGEDESGQRYMFLYVTRLDANTVETIVKNKDVAITQH